MIEDSVSDIRGLVLTRGDEARSFAAARLRAAVYVASVFLSAFLLFLVQPMLAQLLLPIYGGSPAVWNTCLVFFQVLLLAGYAYAHASGLWLNLPRQRAVHGIVLVGSILLVPRAIHAVSSGTWPVAAIIATLVVTAGVPFFVLSTNSSLTQRWYSLGGFSGSADPFWLYAASNGGSLLALLSYPVIVEPAWGLEAQLRWWSLGYTGFVILALVCMTLTRQETGARRREVEAIGTRHDAGVTWRRRVGWVALSAIASSLLLSVTMRITTDVISAPLFWVLPLSLYLLTFIIAFSPRAVVRRQGLAHATAIGIALCLVLLTVPTFLPTWFALVALLGTLFLGALLCHTDLASDRPGAAALTDFYLWVAVGGVVGGLANAVVAPELFSSVVEYPLTLVCLAFVLGRFKKERVSSSENSGDRRTFDVTEWVPSIAMALMIGAAAIAVVLQHRGGVAAGRGILRWEFMPLLVLTVGVLFLRHRGAFVTATVFSAAFVVSGLTFIDPIVDEGRSFFGVSKVTENAGERIMIHGVTVHGEQRRDAALRDIPTSYYTPDGPLGWTVAHMPDHAELGVVGLGSGSLATLARAGQRLTFYEIDPLVARMALHDFTYLRDSKAAVDVKIGDGRQLLEREPDAHFDLLMIDAFDSDQIPTHLLTEEALGLYLRKLKPQGLLVLHISNRYADLTRVLRGWQEDSGDRVAMDEYVPPAAERAEGARATVAVALARRPSALARLAQTRQWFWLDSAGPAVRWTDDHTDLLGVLSHLEQ